MSKYGAAQGSDFPADPTATDDCLSGFGQGFFWRNTVTNIVFRCNSNLPGAAVWQALGGGGDAFTALEARVSALENPIPVNSVAPVISGARYSGMWFVSNGTWSNTPTFTYQWKLNGSPIVGETTQAYTPVAGDVGGLITCTVTATNAKGSASATSSNSPVARILDANLGWSTTALDAALMTFIDVNNVTVTRNATDGNVINLKSRASAGKWYAELYINANTAGDVGIANAANTRFMTLTKTGGLSGVKDGSSTVTVSDGGLIYAVVDCIGVAYDADNQKVYFRVNNGPWNGNSAGNPATNLNGYAVPVDVAEPLFLKAGLAGDNTTQRGINVGSDTFQFSPPSGYFAWAD